MLTSLLQEISDYRVLVVGDGIIDEYCYVKPQGKSPKENIITNRILRTESFRGGVFAAAEHVRGFCAEVDIQQGEEVIGEAAGLAAALKVRHGECDAAAVNAAREKIAHEHC